MYLQQGKEIPKNDNLFQLTPFLDEIELLRIGGRLGNPNISYDKKYQIILGAKYRFTYLLIKYEYLRLLHAGCQSVLASLRERFWTLCTKIKGKWY